MEKSLNFPYSLKLHGNIYGDIANIVYRNLNDFLLQIKIHSVFYSPGGKLFFSMRMQIAWLVAGKHSSF